jgi:hypothetical protein
MKPIRGALFGSFILALIGSVYWVYCIALSTRAHDRGRADRPNTIALAASPAQSEYLRDVVEPIAFVKGISWDDCSQGVAFLDSRQTSKPQPSVMRRPAGTSPL